MSSFVFAGLSQFMAAQLFHHAVSAVIGDSYADRDYCHRVVGGCTPSVVLGQALQKTGYNVLLVAEEEFRRWVAGRGVAFAGLTFNTQAALHAQSKSSNLLQTMNWIRKAAQATMQMGREIADVIQDGDTVFLNEGILALVNGAVEKRRCQVIHINLQPWVPTAEFSGMTPELPTWMPFKKSTYNHWAGGLVRRTQWLLMGKSGNQIRTRYLGLPKQTWNKHRAMLDSTPSLRLASPQVIYIFPVLKVCRIGRDRLRERLDIRAGNKPDAKTAGWQHIVKIFDWVKLEI